MNKKNLDDNVHVDNFNKKLFDKSQCLVAKCKKIPISTISASSSEFKSQEVKDKYNKLQSKLNNILKILGSFVQAEKPTFGNSLDFGVQILEESKVLIQTQLRRNQQEKNTVKKIKNQAKNTKRRPQELYENIGPYSNFQRHSHQNFLSSGIIPNIQPYRGPQLLNSLPLISSEAEYIDTQAKLDQCIQELMQSKQIAVDVEHSNKSYQGMTCLIQISSRQKDYLLDVFPIWKKIPKLSKIISNPKIIKIMHGADMDTKWLQRDFNLHIINLFDTHRASRALGMAKLSYAFLLQHYCKVNTDKKYQKADWRERPLSPQMLLYARMDTHYLLPIYDMMRIDLQKQAKQMNLNINTVLKQIQVNSHQVTLNQAELFSYKSREIYQILQEEFKKKNINYFKAIDIIFWAINSIAHQNDINFDQLLTKKSVIEAISYIKDLIYNKKSKVSKKSRVDRALVSLKNNQGPHVSEIIDIVKPVLQKVFLTKQSSFSVEQDDDLIDKVKPNKQFNLKKNIRPLKDLKVQEPQIFTRCKSAQVFFRQFESLQVIGNKFTQQRSGIKFGSIMSFLSLKYNIPLKQTNNQDLKQLSEQSSQSEQQIDNLEQKPNIAAEEEQIIQFKRMNPNVIYVIEQQDQKSQKEVDDALQKKNPRKKRKQYDYEARLRNKDGNIYDLLQ